MRRKLAVQCVFTNHPWDDGDTLVAVCADLNAADHYIKHHDGGNAVVVADNGISSRVYRIGKLEWHVVRQEVYRV